MGHREWRDQIRRDLKVENIILKAGQTKLYWYANILWMDDGNKVKHTMKMEVRGNQAKGRPRMRWMDNIRHDMNMCGLEEGDAQDRIRWNPDLAS